MSAPKVGLALGSGAARGCTHIGILEVLQEEGIEISYVSGTSIGSIVGAALAAGQLEALKEAVLGLDWRKLVYLTFDLKRIRSGLVDGRKVADFIGESIQVHDFSELKLPFRCVAADLMKGEAVVFSEGDLVSAIRASIRSIAP